MSTDIQQPAKGAYVVLALCCLTLVSTIFLRTCPAVLVPDLQETFKIGPGEVALFSSATFLAYGLMQMPSGLITDAIGGRMTMSIFLVLAAAATFTFAFAPSVEAGVAARFIKGITLADFPAIAAILARYFPAKRYTMAVGMVMGMGNAGALLSSEPLARLSIALGWRYALAISALMVLVLAVAVFVFIKPDKPAAKKTRVSTPEVLKGIGRNMLKVFGTKEFWFMTTWQVCTAASFFAFAAMWAGPYLMDGYGMTKVEASRILLWLNGLALLMVPFIGTLADRINSRRAVIILCSVFGLAGCCGLAFFPGQLPSWLLIVSIMLIGACGAGGGTCLFSLVNRNFPREMIGTGVGCMNMFWPIGASALGMIIGGVVSLLASKAGGSIETLEAAVKAQIYGDAMLIFVGMWGLALVLGLFFIKEDFKVRT